MTNIPEHQPRTDPSRARRGGRRPSREQTRERLLAERRAAVVELARLSRAAEHATPGGTGESPFEESDVAQASEQLDMSLKHRERVAERINRLTRALERLAHGEYGVCEECGHDIEPARLAAMPEVAVCRECQERRERGERAA
jgi:RNA polymerase-binding transcription factor